MISDEVSIEDVGLVFILVHTCKPEKFLISLLITNDIPQFFFFSFRSFLYYFVNFLCLFLSSLNGIPSINDGFIFSDLLF